MEYFRYCNLNDLEELQGISQTAYLEAFYDLLDSEDVEAYVKGKYSLDNLKKEFEDISNHFLFFCVDDKPVGYMKYTLKPNSLEIDRLYMLKSYKGMGTGSRFMDKAEDIAKINGKRSLTLGVLEMNKPAILFYIKKGFVQYSCETITIGKNEYHLLLMKKDLNE